MEKKTLQDLDFKNKKVLVRFDFNVPMQNLVISDETRIKAAIPTIKYLQKQNARLIMFSHLGRIKSESDKTKNTLAPVAKKISELLNQEVIFVPETRGKALENAIKNLPEKGLLLVENTRFEDLNGKKESTNNKELGLYWASLGDVFVNDAFGTAHRAHASNVGIATNIKESCIGFLIEKELTMLNKIVNNPKRPLTAILGGAKVSDKIAVIKQLLTIADKVVIGGGMAYTFMKALGYQIGNSLIEEDKVATAKELIKIGGNKLVLPDDYLVGKEFKNAPGQNTVDCNINDNMMGLDIGSKTIAKITNIINQSSTVFWNGPVGVFEMSNFAFGTKAICAAVAANPQIFSLVGGGDSAAAVVQFNYQDNFSFISTGGGASLEYVEGKTLPGVAAISNK